MNPDTFHFGKLRVRPEARVVRIGADIASKAELLDALSKGLSFPRYFGGNWDALEDCLRDLEWISESSVFVMHDRIPPLDALNLRVYLSILARAVESWRASGVRELVVSFPEECRSVMATLWK